MTSTSSRWASRALICVFSLAALLSLLPATDAAASCTPEREWRWAWWWTGDCCQMEYPPGYYSYYKEKHRRLQYRDRVPNCTWTNWTWHGDTYSVCSTGHPECPVWASNGLDLQPDLLRGDEEPQLFFMPLDSQEATAMACATTSGASPKVAERPAD